MTLRTYLAAVREPRYSILFACPLLVAYEALAALLSRSHVAAVRNGADVLLKTLFVTLGGRNGLVAFGVLLFAGGGWLVWRDLRGRSRGIEARVFGFMVLESLLYALVLGHVVSWLTVLLLSGGRALALLQAPIQSLPLASQLVVSLGAGLYEELLFRVLLVSGLTWLGVRFGWKRWVAVGAAVCASALIFSAFHYLGPYGDALTLPSFTFRVVAGLLLSGLYVARGFGITAWAHALYDVWIALGGVP